MIKIQIVIFLAHVNTLCVRRDKLHKIARHFYTISLAIRLLHCKFEGFQNL